MQRYDQIVGHLARDDARFVCLDPTGARTVEPPSALARFDDHLLSMDSPLELFPNDARTQVVTAFGLCRSNGTSDLEVTLRTGERVALALFDEVATSGCYIAVLHEPIDTAPRTATRLAELPVRYTRYQLDVTGVIVDVDDDLERLLGWRREELIGRPALEIIHPDDHEKGILGWISVLEDGPGGQCRMRQRFLTADDRWLWLEDTTTNHLDDPERGYVDCHLVDISDEMAAQQEAERRDALLTRLTDALPSGVLHLDGAGRPSFWNQRWLELVGSPTASLKALLDICEEAEVVAAALDDAMRHGRDADIDVTLRGRRGIDFGRLHLRPLEHADGTSEVLITFDDTTDARTYQTKLLNQAQRDPLTGLLSRFGLRDVVGDLIQGAEEEPRALLFIDLDRFKPINDAFGHAVGDEVLREVGKAISGAVRASDAVARIGGDEFVVALHARTLDEISFVSERIHAAIGSAEDQFVEDVTIAASIGVAIVSGGDDFDSLLQRADKAMYEQKRARASVEESSDSEI